MTLQHLLTGNEFNKDEILEILALATRLKQDKQFSSNLLQGRHVALLFEKPSLRTRFSFTAAVNQLGGHAIESVSNTRKSEAPKDLIRVIQGYCDAMMLRTFDDAVFSEMQAYATIPIINGLSNLFHPCQAFADLLTLQETFSKLEGLSIAYLGDGNNVLHSLMLLANKLGINIHYSCPNGHKPNAEVLAMLQQPKLVKAFSDPQEAVHGCDAIYTDVWTSMGFDKSDEAYFSGYQVNEAMIEKANPNAVFMHCMPMERGKEVSITLPDASSSVIFQQSENRLHAQKAIMIKLLKEV